jgi:hypothetical protein
LLGKAHSETADTPVSFENNPVYEDWGTKKPERNSLFLPAVSQPGYPKPIDLCTVE